MTFDLRPTSIPTPRTDRWQRDYDDIPIVVDAAEKMRVLERDLWAAQRRIEDLECRLSNCAWRDNPDRQGGYTPPQEIRDGWDQWGH